MKQLDHDTVVWLRVCIVAAVDSTGRSSLQELLHAVNVAERTSSSEASELPLGQWEIEALRGRADILPPQLLMASPAQSARKLSVEALAGMADVLVMSGALPVGHTFVFRLASWASSRQKFFLKRNLSVLQSCVANMASKLTHGSSFWLTAAFNKLLV